MTSNDIRKKFLKYFKNKKHVILPSAPVIPENDPTVLFTTAGMHPLVPFLLGEPHPAGTRLANCQKCIRTGDIDSVGDKWHMTFFEMLGNWSLGDYFKKEAVAWSYEFLTHKDYLHIDPSRLHVSVFGGDAGIPKDTESFNLWRSVGIPEERIYYFGKKENWWGPPGKTGPCGPDTEIYYDTGVAACGPGCDPSCDCGKYVEIWNNVFMQYNKKADGTYELLKQKNVDTGMGLERITAVMQGKNEVYETDLFIPIMEAISKLAKNHFDTSKEIIADHLRAATFIMADGISPSNIDQGYVLRRLIRRAIRHAKRLGIEECFCGDIAKIIIEEYKDVYPELNQNRSEIIMELITEEDKFRKTLNNGLKKFAEYKQSEVNDKIFSGKAAFDLYQSYGFPLEMTQEEAKKSGLLINEKEFCEKLKEHQKLSKESTKGKFSGGLADASEQSRKYHTATHLLHKALKTVLGDHVQQKGSNINEKRLRFDFSHPSKMTAEQIKKTEELVNEIIIKDIEVKCEEMSLDQAQCQKAIGLFANKYGDKVRVYTVGDFSKEICGGPHVKKTKELGHFRILKEESSSAGVRRIKAVLE
jgi:alanyl-tRNA synthetase